MAHLSRWMAGRDLEPGDVRRVEIERFVHERRASGRLQLASARALVPLLGHLRGLGVVPAAGSREAPTSAGALLYRYAEYLLVRRGLAGETVRGYCNTARAFLTDREQIAGDLALGTLDVAAINECLLRISRRGSVYSTKVAVTGLRSLSRLGLRVGEVAALRLEEVEWRAGELVVSGKGSRQERLPLPVDVGEAIAKWLRDGRPDCQSRFVFARMRAPHEGLHPSSLNAVVHRACRRADLPEVGPHRLASPRRRRRCAPAQACAMSGRCCDIGSDVTSIYAKVDRRALAALVQPWPRATA